MLFGVLLMHHLELAIKVAFKNTFFSTINEMMLRLYYIYCKAPKKCRELEDLIAELAWTDLNFPQVVEVDRSEPVVFVSSLTKLLRWIELLTGLELTLATSLL